jgi:hypothetical protein
MHDASAAGAMDLDLLAAFVYLFALVAVVGSVGAVLAYFFTKPRMRR